ADQPDAEPRRDPGPPEGVGLKPYPDPPSSAPRLCQWLQSSSGGKSHRDVDVARRGPRALQRSGGRRSTDRQDCDGLQWGGARAHPSAAPVKTGTKIPPIARLETV